MKFTDEQQCAIDTRNCNILVSAAAGSGKTGVLTERIVARLREGTNIDELLVLTYTRAAAGEMKERVREKIRDAAEAAPVEERDFWHRQQNLIGDAPITTIHAFCQRLIKRHYNLIPGLDPNFRIADGHRNDLLKSDILTAYFEECCLEPDEEWRRRYFELFRHYGSRLNEEGLKKEILSLVQFASAQGNPEVWLKDALNRFGDFDFWYENAVAYGKNGLELLIAETKQDISILERKGGPDSCIDTLKEDVSNLEELLAEFCWEVMGDAKPFDRKKPKKKTDDPDLTAFTVERRDIRKKYFIEDIQSLFHRDFKTYAEEIGILTPLMETLVTMTLEFYRRYAAEKLKQSAIDFSDLELYSLKLLTEHPELAEEYRRNFKEVLIDEYQDVNGLQEQIITCLAGKNRLFTVGDIKQSIYGFRLANHELFRNRAEDYTRNQTGKMIYLNRNFRSRKEVLSVTNRVFDRLLNPSVSDIGYREEDRLVFGSESYGEKTVPVEFAVLDCTAKGYEDSVLPYHGRFIAKRIKELMAEGMTVGSEGKEHPLTYGDITVLMRSAKKDGESIAEELRSWGIPAVSPQSIGFLSGRETRLLCCFLEVLDNPLQDIPLAAVMRSNLFNFNEDEILALSLNRHKRKLWEMILQAETLNRPEVPLAKTVAFREEILSLRKRAKIYPVGELVDDLVREYDFSAFWGGLPNGRCRQRNLELFREEAFSYQREGNGGLFDFLRYLKHLAATGGDVPGEETAENDCVQIITIHHSKGLEFPVVFLANTEKKRNSQDTGAPLVVDRELGFGPKYNDYKRRTKVSSLPQRLIKKKKEQAEIAEEMRALYVAMTRASEKLIITASYNGVKDKTLEERLEERGLINGITSSALPGTMILDASNSFQWLSSSLMPHCKDSNDLSVSVEKILSAEEAEDVSANKLIYPPGDLERLVKTTAINPETALPSKVSVSSLLPQGDWETDEISLPTPRFLSGTKELHAAEKGTAFHTFMEHLDFRRSYTGVELAAFRDGLIAQGIFSAPAGNSVNIDAVQVFLNSTYGKELQSAIDIRREMAFVGGFTAAELFPEAAGDTRTVILQGAIDLLYRRRNGEWVLLDYKTNNIKHSGVEAFLKKYGRQMELYAEALKRIYGIEVKERVFFLTGSGDFIGY